MVVAPVKGGVGPFVILADGEQLPANLNHEKTVVMRRGKSTDNELRIVKAFGALADPALLRAADICEYKGEDGTPLHKHANGLWWFYDVDYVFEKGPFATYEEARTALVDYCVDYQNKFGENDSTIGRGDQRLGISTAALLRR